LERPFFTKGRHQTNQQQLFLFYRGNVFIYPLLPIYFEVRILYLNFSVRYNQIS
jgi:hypothetical protein